MLLKNICTIVNGSTPSTSNSEYWDGNISWITPKDMSLQMKRYISKGERNITQKGYDSCSTTLVPKDTILLTSRAPIGYISIAQNELCTNQGFKSIICGDKVLPLFMYYWLSTKVDFLKSISNGATFKELSKQALENVEIDLPNLETQQHIVDTIGSVDETIEKLTKTNETIDQYLSLYIKNYLNKAETSIKQINSVALVKNGFAFKPADYLIEETDESLEVLKIGHIEISGGLKINPKKDFVSRSPSLNNFILSENDIVLGMTDMKDKVVILGVPAMIEQNNKYVLNQRVARITQSKINPILLYYQMKDRGFIHSLQLKANKGVQVNLTTEAIRNMEIMVLNNEDKAFDEKITNIYQALKNNNKKIKQYLKIKSGLLKKYFG